MVAKCLEGPITSQITATAIQLHSGEITVVLDEAAASKLVMPTITDILKD